jgi:penicillin G amidase
MARFGVWTGRVAVALAALAVIGCIGLVLWLRSSLPQVDGELSLPGLEHAVSVQRDRYGVPHIKAETMLDAYRTLGFVHAQDRLFQMEVMRRAGQGRTAELIGSKALEIDRRIRVLGLTQLVNGDLDSLEPPVREALAAYAAGVNAFLETETGALPPEFLVLPDPMEKWQPADSLLWLKLMALRLTSDWSDELERAKLSRRLTQQQIMELYPEVAGPVTIAALPPPTAINNAWNVASVVEEGAGSNVWVHAGRLTATGAPILANDPHLGLTVPGTWYLVRIETPEGVVAGATAPGFPFVVLGHNEKLAWGVTNTYSDTSDVFVERLDPNDPGRYLTPEGSAPFQTRGERIGVRFGKPVDVVVRSTRHGPVISDGGAQSEAGASGSLLALAHTALQPGDITATALWKVQRASSASELLDATRAVRAPQQNIAFADTSGTIGLIAPALVPKRRKPTGPLPVPGWTGEYDWDGFLPFEVLPQSIDPPAGVLVNANNRLFGAAYPFDLGNAWQPPYRAEAILRALSIYQPQTIEGSLAVQRNLMSLAARALLAKVDWSLMGEAAPTDLLRAMAAWDGTMAGDRPEPLYFHAWLRELVRLIYADELGDLFPDHRSGLIERVLYTLTKAPQWCDDITTPAVETCNAIMFDAFSAAFQLLTQNYDSEWHAWRWDRAHVARFRHVPFGFVPVLRELFDVVVPHDGGRYTPNAGVISFNEHTLFQQVHGATFRAVYDLADLDQSRFMQAAGQSGNIFSEHYDDLARPWSHGETISLGPLAPSAGDTLILTPAE